MYSYYYYIIIIIAGSRGTAFFPPPGTASLLLLLLMMMRHSLRAVFISLSQGDRPLGLEGRFADFPFFCTSDSHVRSLSLSPYLCGISRGAVQLLGRLSCIAFWRPGSLRSCFIFLTRSLTCFPSERLVAASFPPFFTSPQWQPWPVG